MSVHKVFIHWLHKKQDSGICRHAIRTVTVQRNLIPVLSSPIYLYATSLYFFKISLEKWKLIYSQHNNIEGWKPPNILFARPSSFNLLFSVHFAVGLLSNSFCHQWICEKNLNRQSICKINKWILAGVSRLANHTNLVLCILTTHILATPSHGDHLNMKKRLTILRLFAFCERCWNVYKILSWSVNFNLRIVSALGVWEDSIQTEIRTLDHESWAKLKKKS